MLDQHDRDLEGIADFVDVLHQLGRLRGVHARRRLVEQQQLGAGRQRAHDLQPPLRAVGEASRLRVRLVLHPEDREQLQRLLPRRLLRLPVFRQAQGRGQHVVMGVVVHPDQDVVDHRQVLKEPDVLEGARHARPVDLDGAHPLGVPAVDEDLAAGGLVDLGQQVEDGRLARAVRADEAADLGAADGEVEVVDGGQPAEFDAQPDRLHDGGIGLVALGEDLFPAVVVVIGQLVIAHCLTASPFFFPPKRFMNFSSSLLIEKS